MDLPRLDSDGSSTVSAPGGETGGVLTEPFMPAAAGAELARLRRRQRRLEDLLAEADLRGLQARIAPHFLFNSLSAVRELLRMDRAASAERMVTRMSGLLRRVLAMEGRRKVPLREEIDLVRRYVEVERIRFGSRLDLKVELSSVAEGSPVPPLLLQPLVENAIRHGLSGRPDGGTIEIRAVRSSRWLKLEVRDDGNGLPAGWSLDRVGTGLGSTRELLQRLYGSRHRFRVDRRPSGGTRVSIALPWRPGSAST